MERLVLARRAFVSGVVLGLVAVGLSAVADGLDATARSEQATCDQAGPAFSGLCQAGLWRLAAETTRTGVGLVAAAGVLLVLFGAVRSRVRSRPKETKPDVAEWGKR